ARGTRPAAEGKMARTSVGIKAATNDLAAHLGRRVISATPMTDKTWNLGLAEWHGALRAVVFCCNSGMHLRYASGKQDRKIPYWGL
ncbi:MAG: hypothetical protein NTV46_02020, partial [Verrucomicrobia bacterium]|nr:hypothetical protein [Verrucomicrobiota bacterium]